MYAIRSYYDEAEFRASYPRIAVVSDRMFCIDGDRITCAGGTAAIDLAVELLARACGRTKALKGRNNFV